MTENILNPKLPLLNLDVQKQQEWAAPAQLMTQGDKGYIQPFTLSQNWEKYQVDTTSLGLRFSKPDGNIYDSGVTASGIVTETGLTSAGFKTYEIELPKELTQVPGTVTAYIYAANSAGTIVASSNRFTYQVLPEFSADPSSTTYIKGLDEIRDQINSYLDKIKTLSDSYGADKDAIVANMKKQAQQWLSQEQDELSNQLTAEQQKLSDLSQKYTDKYNQLISQLPDADTAITQKINQELADIQKQAQDALKGVDLSKYELKSDLAEKLDTINKALEKAISIDDVNRALASYATKADLDKKADKSELSNYATKDDLKAVKPGAPDLSGYETKSDHANDINGIRDALVNKANTADLATYETKADAKKALDTKANASDLANYATKDDLTAKADKTALAGYATKDELTAKADKTALAGYATKDELKAIQPGAPDLSGYETKSDHKKDIDAVNDTLKGKADVASLSNLATKAEVANKADKTDIPDTSQFATKTDLDTKADKTVLAGYATKTDLDTKADKTALDAKANTSDLTAYETKEDAKKSLDAKANTSDLAAYATKTDLAAKADKTELATYATKDDLAKVKPGETDLSGYETTAAHKKDIDAIRDTLDDKADMSDLDDFATKDELRLPQPFINERNTPYTPGYPLTRHGALFEQYVMPQGPDAVNNYAGRYLNVFNETTISTFFNKNMLNGLLNGSFDGLQVGKIWGTPRVAGYTLNSIVAGVNCLGESVTDQYGIKVYKNYVVMIGLATVSQLGGNVEDASYDLKQYAHGDFMINDYENLLSQSSTNSKNISSPMDKILENVGYYLQASYGDSLGYIASKKVAAIDNSEITTVMNRKYAQILNQAQIFGRDIINTQGTTNYYNSKVDYNYQQLPLFKLQTNALNNLLRATGCQSFWLRDLSIDTNKSQVKPILLSAEVPTMANESVHAAPVVFYYTLVNPNEQ